MIFAGSRRVAIALACWMLLTPLAFAGEIEFQIPEPPGLWTGALHGETPPTLSGAAVIDAIALEKLLPKKPLLVDVRPREFRPKGLPASKAWMPSSRSIPGAVWFPDAGRGDLPKPLVQSLLDRINELTNDDKSAPIVTFCQPQCWGSWNMGKRLVQAGYTSVYWFPEGVSGWQEHGDTSPVSPEPKWMREAFPSEQ
jgi:PQQ-dependent catabolism-associated CXXCW motif protein